MSAAAYQQLCSLLQVCTRVPHALPVTPSCSLAAACRLAHAQGASQEDGAAPFADGGTPADGYGAWGSRGPGDRPVLDDRPSPRPGRPDKCGRASRGRQPVCGRDGQSYGSPYAACLGGTSPHCYKRCPCAKPVVPPNNPERPSCPSCICTKEYNPVCCGGQRFGNPCMAACCGYKNCPPCPDP
jgi:hypothetical protein